MNIYIFRHGDTINTKDPLRSIIHWKDTHKLPILPDGKNALKKEGKFLKEIKTDANYCSPYLRCRESAEIVSKVTGYKFKVDERLSELEGSEKFKDFKNRVNNFLGEISKKYSSVAICTHGAVIAAIKHLSKNKRFYPFQVIDYPRPGVMTILKDGKILQKDFN